MHTVQVRAVGGRAAVSRMTSTPRDGTKRRWSALRAVVRVEKPNVIRLRSTRGGAFDEGRDHRGRRSLQRHPEQAGQHGRAPYRRRGSYGLRDACRSTLPPYRRTADSRRSGGISASWRICGRNLIRTVGDPALRTQVNCPRTHHSRSRPRSAALVAVRRRRGHRQAGAGDSEPEERRRSRDCRRYRASLRC